MKFLASFLFAVLLLAQPAQAEIKIAIIGPLTGANASEGERMQKGASAAVAAINAGGGVLGQNLKLISLDDACDPKQAVAAANRAVGEGVVAVIGHYCSGSSIPASAVYFEEGIVQITPASTNPQLTEQGFDNVFRICGRDDQQGRVVAQYLIENFKGRNIAVLHDKSAYGKGIAEEMQAALNAGGIREVFYDSINVGERDFSALVTRLKQMRVDILFFGGYPTEAGLLIRQMREQKLNSILVGGDALNANEFWSLTGEAGTGTLMSFGPDVRKRPEAASVVQAFRDGGYEPEGYTLYTYAAIELLAQALNTAGAADSDGLVVALKGGEFNTVMGPLSFDAKGDIKQPAFMMYRWEKGSYGAVDDEGAAAAAEKKPAEAAAPEAVKEAVK